MSRIAAFLLFLLLWSNSAFAAIALDGSATTSGSTSSVAALTTTNATDVVIVFAVCADHATDAAITDAGSHTWTKRNTIIFNSGVAVAQEWYTTTSGTLSSVNITATWAACTSSRIFVFGISGADLTFIFDTNGSLPAATSLLTSTSNATISGISTSNANDMIFSMFRGIGSSNGQNALPTGFANIQAPNMVGNSAYEIVSSTQTAASFTYTSAGTNTAAMLLDAVRQAGSPTPTASNLLLNSD